MTVWARRLIDNALSEISGLRDDRATASGGDDFAQLQAMIDYHGHAVTCSSVMHNEGCDCGHGRATAILARLSAHVDRQAEALHNAEGRLRLLGAHEFTGRLDRYCTRCNQPDRHPIHSAMLVSAAALVSVGEGQ